MEAILERYKKVPSTCAADATEGLNNMDAAIKPLDERWTVCGRAFTVKMPAGDNMMVLRAISEAKPGDILVIDSNGYTSRSVAGEFVVGLARTLGLGGMVVDGSVRDAMNIKASGFPVFCRPATASASVKIGNGRTQVPVACGGVAVRPGDIIVGDADGVVVILQEEAESCLLLAERKLQKDEERAAKALKNPETARAYLNNLLRK